MDKISILISHEYPEPYSIVPSVQETNIRFDPFAVPIKKDSVVVG